MSSASTARLLLVEFVNVDMHPGQCGLLFPFIKGFLAEVGIPIDWVRFGVRSGVQLQRNEDGIGLSQADRRLLLDAVQRTRATHLLFSEPPARSLLRQLRDEASPPGWDQVRIGGPARDLHLTSDLLEWLEGDRGQHDRSSGASDSVFDSTPDFGWELGNDLAGLKPPIAHVFAGPECLHRAPLERNPAYRGVDLERATRRFGCAFCAELTDQGPTPGVTESVDRALLQINAALATIPRRTERIQYVIHGAHIARQIDRLAERLAGSEIAAGDFLVPYRATDIVASADRIERAIEAMEGSGHTLNAYLLGLENFSQAELDRMNKGCSTIDIVSCVRTLKDLERRYPNTFFFRKHKGLSTILFTPWTTVSDLRFNLRLVSLLGIGDALGKLFDSRLRLMPGLAMTALAERDGLLVDRYADPVLNTARRTLYEQEMPWRFSHPEVETAARIAIRFRRDELLDDDDLYRRVQDLLRALPDQRRNQLAVFEELLDLLQAGHESASPEEILTLLRERLLTAPAGTKPHACTGSLSQFVRHHLDRIGAEAALLLELGRAGLKPVSKIEHLTREEVEQVLQLPPIQQFPYQQIREPRWTVPGTTPDNEIFLAFDEDALREAVACTVLVETSKDKDKVRRAIRDVGILLGYPACCATAYSQEHSAAHDRDRWLMVQRRMREPGAIPPVMNPTGHAFRGGFIPCSFNCPAATTLLERALTLLGEAADDRAPEAPRTSTNPMFFSLSQKVSFELVPDGLVSEDFAYQLAPGERCTGRFVSLAQGDRLQVDPGRISVLRAGELIDRFDLDAVVWWHRRAFHSEFWRICAEEVLRPARTQTNRSASRQRPEPQRQRSLPASQLAPELRAAFETLSRPDTVIAGWTIAAVSIRETRSFTVDLRLRGDRISLFVKPRDAVDEYFLASPRYALQYAASTPIDTIEKRRAVEALLERLG